LDNIGKKSNLETPSPQKTRMKTLKRKEKTNLHYHTDSDIQTAMFGVVPAVAILAAAWICRSRAQSVRRHPAACVLIGR